MGKHGGGLVSDLWLVDHETLLPFLQGLLVEEKKEEDELRQLNQLITDICIGVGMDEGGRAHFVVEVEELTHRIVGLRESLLALQANLTAREEEEVRVGRAVDEARQVVEESSTALLAASPAEVLAQLGAEERVEQLGGLREQLLRLSQAEGHLSGLPSPSQNSSTAMVQVQQAGEGVSSTLNQWQRVFEDTLSRYHRLSASLVGEDLALEVWRDQVNTITRESGQKAATSYSQLGERLREMALERSLLSQSQQLMLRVPGPDTSQLAERSRGALDLLEERSRVLRTRQVAWEQHTVRMESLSIWLREMEREKAKLNLKHVALRRVRKVLQRIEELLARIPAGEAMLKEVSSGQAALATDSFQASALSGFRNQLHSIQDRVSSLQAGLLTWRDHLHRLERLAGQCRQQEETAGVVMDEQTEVVSAPLPDTSEAAAVDLRLCQSAICRLEELTPELESLAALQEELKECVSPSDIKQTTQRAWLLWQRQADLSHQLALRIQELEGRSALLQLFWTQHGRFLEWTETITQRLERSDVSGLTTGLRAEVASKEQEIGWLERAGSHVEGRDRQEVEEAAARATTSYQAVLELLETLLARQRNSQSAEMAFNTELNILKQWLADFEARARTPADLRGTSEKEYKEAKERQAALDREINQESGRVSTVLNDGEVLLLSLPSVQLAVQLTEVEEAWKLVCSLTSSRGEELEEVWERWQQVVVPGTRLVTWLDSRRQEVEVTLAEVKQGESRERQKQLDIVMADIINRTDKLEQFNALYADLAKEGRLDEYGELKALHDKVNKDLSTLSTNTTSLIRSLADRLSQFESLLQEKESEMILLRQLDAQVTEVQVSSKMEDEEKRRRLGLSEKDLRERTVNLEQIMKRTFDVKKIIHMDDAVTLDSNITELSVLHEDIKARLLRLMDDLCVEEEAPERQVTITVHKAKKLQKKGLMGKADPYVQLTLGEKKLKSKTVKNNQNPEWKFEARFTLNKSSQHLLTLEVFDEDFGSDDSMGHLSLDLSQEQLAETWIPLQNCKSGAVLVSITSDAEEPTKYEQDRGVQVDLPLPADSGFVSADGEMTRRVAACRADIGQLEESLDITEDRDLLHTELAQARASLELCRGCTSAGEEGRGMVAGLSSQVQLLEARVQEKMNQETNR